MSDHYSIQIENVSKMYKMYKSNLAKITDLLGISFKKNYEEFWPLKEINLKIKKGEKVGIIGRNGAGKTTLLSMIADNTKPTSGTISVNGQVNALFVLGTGFHPEFSGRENIYASLAFQGITGKEAKSMEYEIIEFSELEDFIDQPVKTYSAGMYARLAFTVATAIRPEVLIIDEVLGAGDAYFASKALERMKELTSGGTTVLFVSHDLSSVQQMCERCIWIDRGKVREDGDTLSVLKAYSADVRRREEQRLQKKNKLHIQEELPERQLIFRFTGVDGTAPKTGLPIHRIALSIKGEKYAEILVGDSMDNSIQEVGHLITDQKTINWSEPLKQDSKWYREFVDLGRTNVHAAGIFLLPPSVTLNELVFEIEYQDVSEQTVQFELYNAEHAIYETVLDINTTSTGDWMITEAKIFPDISAQQEENNQPAVNHMNDIYGAGDIEIDHFYMTDENDQESYVHTLNDSMTFKIHFHTNRPVPKAVFVVAIYGLDGKVITQLISKEKGIKFSDIRDGAVNFHIQALKIGAGEYLVSLGIFPDIDLINPVEQEAFCIHDRKYRFKVVQPLHLNMNLGQLYQDCQVSYEESV